MTSVLETKIGDTHHMHYYDPKENTNVSLVPKQLYPMHAKSLAQDQIREVDVKGKHRAKVYNIVYEIAEECGKLTFNTSGGEVGGSSFVGKEVYATGIFMFLNPKHGDTFEANNGANERYLRFCETIRIKCPEVEVDIEGERRMVKEFPALSKNDIIGKPIMGLIDIVEYVKDGETRISYKVKDFSPWVEGKIRDFELDALPF